MAKTDIVQAGPREVERPPQTLKELILSDNLKDALQRMAPEGVNPERYMTWVNIALKKNPDLQNCTLPSIQSAVLTGIGMNLEPDSVHGALVPFKSECQFMPMFTGLIKLARESGEVWKIDAYCAYEGETFRVIAGTDPRIEHEPLPPSKRGKMIATYAVAHFRNGGTQFRVCDCDYLDKVEKGAKSRGGKVWGYDREQMALKTAIRYLAKLLPRTPAMTKAFEYDDQHFGMRDRDTGPDAKRPERVGVINALKGALKEPETHDDSHMLLVSRIGNHYDANSNNPNVYGPIIEACKAAGISDEEWELLPVDALEKLAQEFGV